MPTTANGHTARDKRPHGSRRRKGNALHHVTDEIHDALTDTADDLDGRLPAGPGYHRALMLVVVAVGAFALGVAWGQRD